MNKLIYNGRPATKKLMLGYLKYTFSDMWVGGYTHFITIWYHGGYCNTRTDDSFSDNGSSSGYLEIDGIYYFNTNGFYNAKYLSSGKVIRSDIYGNFTIEKLNERTNV